MLYCATVSKASQVEKIDIDGNKFSEYFSYLNKSTVSSINDQVRISGYAIVDTPYGNAVVANSDAHREFVVNDLVYSNSRKTSNRKAELRDVVAMMGERLDADYFTGKQTFNISDDRNDTSFEDEANCCGKCTGFCK